MQQFGGEAAMGCIRGCGREASAGRPPSLMLHNGPADHGDDPFNLPFRRVFLRIYTSQTAGPAPLSISGFPHCRYSNRFLKESFNISSPFRNTIFNYFENISVIFFLYSQTLQATGRSRMPRGYPQNRNFPSQMLETKKGRWRMSFHSAIFCYTNVLYISGW